MKAPNFRTLDLNLLRVFDQVMSERNLTRAARNLAMTQPAVSNSLNRLREAVGDKLVVRSGYGVQPTPRALSLWPAIADALRQMEASLTPGDFVASEATKSPGVREDSICRRASAIAGHSDRARGVGSTP